VKYFKNNKPFRDKIILQILDYYKNLWALSYASGVAHWDLETYMPSKGAAARGEALGRLSVIKQKMFLDGKFVELIHQVEKIKDLTDAERGVVRVLARSLDFYEKIPSDFLDKFENLTNTATVIWREAKEKNNFKLFEPSLSKIFSMNREMAEYLGYENSPYDALLDQYEEGLTSKSVSQLFSEVKRPLQELLGKIQSSPKYFKVHPLENASYNKEKMQDLNNKILKFLWRDFGKNFRLDVSTHPFTTSFSNQDTRITTWYHKTDFARSILAVIHEFGHALYDLQCDSELEMTPIQGGSSLVIHESQSRLWENFVGRSEEFIKFGLDDFNTIVDKIARPEDYYLYFNKVSPGPLRVEADEVTYHFHIMLRFEIEKGFIEGKLKVKDLPEIWNAKMKEYLGIKPKNDSEGVLQDVHWSGGTVGYFPTYSLGTFLSAQWAERINNSQFTPVKRGQAIYNYGGIEKWLGDHIHKYGSTYTLQDLLKKNKMKFDPKVNLKYLQEKYGKIYGF
jgi:carboxypeptidase Taq